MKKLGILGGFWLEDLAIVDQAMKARDRERWKQAQEIAKGLLMSPVRVMAELDLGKTREEIEKECHRRLSLGLTP